MVKNKIKKNNNNFSTKRQLITPYFIIAIFLILIPFLFILFYAFIIPVPAGDTNFFKINLSNFIKFFSDSNLVASLFYSIGYAFLAAILSVIMGYPFAYFLSFSKSKLLKDNIFLLITLPLWINMLMKVIGLQTIFRIAAPNLLGTGFSIVIGMSYMFLPFAILPMYNSFSRIDRSLIEASNDLGANRIQTFFKIIFHFSISGIFIAITLVVVQASTSLVVVKYMGIGKINLISKVIESYFFKGSDFGLGAAISLILVVFISIIFIISKLIEKRIEGKFKFDEKVF